MTYKLDTNYSEKELKFLKEHNCEILAAIKLGKTSFSEYEIPRRMFQYGGEYIAEIVDDETQDLVWAVFYRQKDKDTILILEMFHEREDFMRRLFGIITTSQETIDYWRE